MVDTNVIFVVSVVASMLIFNEWFWRGRGHGEASRKSIHIAVGSFVALWPFWLNWQQIELLGVAFVIAVLISKQFGVFNAIHNVPRVTWGELYFGAAIILTPLITDNAAIYATAILHMSLADGFAAVIGHKYGNKHRYQVLGAHKSYLGTLTFAVVSYALLIIFTLHQGIPIELWLPVTVLVATALENVAIKGLDNIALPVFIAIVLQTIG